MSYKSNRLWSLGVAKRLRAFRKPALGAFGGVCAGGGGGVYEVITLNL